MSRLCTECILKVFIRKPEVLFKGILMLSWLSRETLELTMSVRAAVAGGQQSAVLAPGRKKPRDQTAGGRGSGG